MDGMRNKGNNVHIEAPLAVPQRDAPFLLDYVPTYRTTIDGRSQSTRSQCSTTEGTEERLEGRSRGILREERDEYTPHPSQGSDRVAEGGSEGELEGEEVGGKGIEVLEVMERVPLDLGRLVDSNDNDSVEIFSGQIL